MIYRVNLIFQSIMSGQTDSVAVLYDLLFGYAKSEVRSTFICWFGVDVYHVYVTLKTMHLPSH